MGQGLFFIQSVPGELGSNPGIDCIDIFFVQNITQRYKIVGGNQSRIINVVVFKGKLG